MLQPELDVLTGQRVTISYYDEVAMNMAYDCAEGCPETCENHGYVRRINGDCQCFCPPYLGELCHNYCKKKKVAESLYFYNRANHLAAENGSSKEQRIFHNQRYHL